MVLAAVHHRKLADLKNVNSHPVCIAPDLAHREYEKSGRTVRLTTSVQRVRHRDGADAGEYRSVLIASDKVQIFNAFLYPVADLDAPLYAMEVVKFGPKVVIGVVDLVGLPGSEGAGDAATNVLTSASGRWPIPRGQEAPQWFEDCRSGADVFVRPTSSKQFSDLLDLDSQVWHDALTLLRHADRRADVAPHTQALANYAHHHRIYTPGLAFLQRGFGEAWTERFLDCVFAAPV